jgi:hypothetical protein
VQAAALMQQTGEFLEIGAAPLPPAVNERLARNLRG